MLQLDPDTGDIMNEFGDGLTIALAIEPYTQWIYVSSGNGVEIFDPATQTFTHYSRDRNLRVGGLAFAPDGTLWATTWPDRRQVVRFNERDGPTRDALIRLGHRLARVRPVRFRSRGPAVHLPQHGPENTHRRRGLGRTS